MSTTRNLDVDVLVIGGGQAALATAYFLRRTGLSFLLVDAEDGPGGAWRHAWDSFAASATLVGVTRYARDTVAGISAALEPVPQNSPGASP